MMSSTSLLHEPLEQQQDEDEDLGTHYRELLKKRDEAEKCLKLQNTSGPNHTDLLNLAKAVRKKDTFRDLEAQMVRAGHIAKDFKTYYENSVQAPVPTFGSIMVPVSLNTKVDPLHSSSVLRNYLVLADNSSLDDIRHLLVDHWECNLPNVVLSFTHDTGSTLTQNQLQNFVTSLYRFCKSTGVWLLTDGLHSGVSRLLGRIFQHHLEPDRESQDPEFQRKVKLIGICEWSKVKDQTLLHGISLETYYDSMYFYAHERALASGDMERTLSPFHHAFLLTQSLGDQPIDLKSKFECFLNKGRVGLSHSQIQDNAPGEMVNGNENIEMTEIGKRAIPVVHIVFGDGDNRRTLQKIKDSLDSKMSVIVAQQSGDLPKKLALLYQKLEHIVPRSCNHEVGMTEEEKKTFNKQLQDHSFNQLRPLTEILKCIMQSRYYLTIWDLADDKAADFRNIIRAVYKPYTSTECMSIAIQTESLSFLTTYHNRDEDKTLAKEEKEQGLTTAKELIALHRENLMKTDTQKLFGIKRDPKDIRDRQILQLVGRTIHILVRYKFTIMYQAEITSLQIQMIGDTPFQSWHLFLYAVLSDKQKLVEYFLCRTRSPIGAALFACKMYRSLRDRAIEQIKNEKANKFSKASNYFEDLALKILNAVYEENPNEAYISLTREVPFALGPYITPLSLAEDSVSMRFMESECCQTYLQKIWTGGMYLGTWKKLALPVFALIPLVGVPMIAFGINFEENKTPEGLSQDMVNRKDKPDESTIPRDLCSKFSWKMKTFYKAPVTKCNISMITYMFFLGVLSYFFLTKLQPVRSVVEISRYEWVCYVWVIGLLVEEIAQLVSIKHTGPKGEKLSNDVWTKWRRFKLKMYKPILYIQDGSWNWLDLLMLVFFGITTICRFSLSVERFQMVRILYSISIILFFFRTLRYFYILKVIGPRIIAIYKMLIELILFMLILVVFMVSFGVAFQGLLNPLQSSAPKIVNDVLWRSYWPIFGELFIEEDDKMGMGREVGNSSCLKLKEHGQSGLECYSSIPNALLGIYLFISNILLLNLLIAIFGNTLNKIESLSSRHWAFHQYSIVQEYYHKPPLPAPLNMFFHLVNLFLFCKGKCKRRSPTSDHFRTAKELSGQYVRWGDPPQKKAIAKLQLFTKISIAKNGVRSNEESN